MSLEEPETAVEPEEIPDSVCYGMGIIQHLSLVNMCSMNEVHQLSDELELNDLSEWLEQNVIGKKSGAYTILLNTFPDRCEQADIDFTKYEQLGEEIRNNDDPQQQRIIPDDIEDYNDLSIPLEDDVDLSVDPHELTADDIPRSVCVQMEIIRQLGVCNMHSYNCVYDTARELEFTTLAAWLERYVVGPKNVGINKSIYMTLLETFPNKNEMVVFNFQKTPFDLSQLFISLGIDDEYINNTNTGIGVCERVMNRTEDLQHIPITVLVDALNETIEQEVQPNTSTIEYRIYCDIHNKLTNYDIDLLKSIYLDWIDDSNQTEVNGSDPIELSISDSNSSNGLQHKIESMTSVDELWGISTEKRVTV